MIGSNFPQWIYENWTIGLWENRGGHGNFRNLLRDEVRRFAKNKRLYQDLAALEARRFKEIDKLLENERYALSKVSNLASNSNVLANVKQVTLREGRWQFPNFMMPYFPLAPQNPLIKDIEYMEILDDIIIITMGEKNEVQYFKRKKKKLENFLVKNGESFANAAYRVFCYEWIQ